MYGQPKTGISGVVYIFLAIVALVISGSRWLVAKGKSLAGKS